MSVSITQHNQVAVICMDDGNKNVINHDVLDALESAFDQATSDEAGAIIFKGREGSFCAGYDLAVMKGADPQAASRLGRRGGLLARRILSSPIPVVGLSQGHSFTIGAVWLACCDLSIGERGAYKYGMTEVTLNVPLTGWALEPVKARLARSERIPALLHSKLYPPEQAQAAGFIDELVASGEGLTAALARAEPLAGLPRDAYLATKLALRQSILDSMNRDLG
ncbi:MAG: crotonase/enoyl-CoA hydratase family protein [Pseudomonadota bacterium]